MELTNAVFSCVKESCGRSSIRNRSPRFVINRLGVLLVEILHPDWPWLTKHSILALESLLKSSDKGFEWGCGRSTVWFARRVSEMASVEHNPVFAEKINGILKTENLKNASVTLREASRDAMFDNSHPYVAEIGKYPPEFFNIIHVDGLARDYCVLKAVKHLKPGGLLVVDNINVYLPYPDTKSPNSRKPADGPDGKLWIEFLEQVSDWRNFWTTNGVWDTTIWFKP